MIGFLKGTIASKSETQIVVDVQGVGYEVHLSKTAVTVLGDVGAAVRLEIYTHFTDSSLQLYGFLSSDEKMIFKKIISVSGIGPKIGLSIIGAYPFEHLVGTIVRGDLAALTSISGVGRKTAERIVMELKDKFKALEVSQARAATPAAGWDRRVDDTLEALLSLGYTENTARKALQRIGLLPEDTVQSLIKKSLGVMSQ